MASIRYGSRLLAGLLTMLVIAACNESTTEPEEPVTAAEIVGTYDATELTANGISVSGAQLTLTLSADGTTSGELFVPEQGGGGETSSMEGTYSFDQASATVTLDQPADTFVRDMELQAVRAGGTVQLRGEDVFSDVTIRVVLQRR